MDVKTPAEKKKKEKRKPEIIEDSVDWLYIQNPNKDNYDFKNEKLVMTASKSSLTDNNVPSFLGIRQESPSMSIETEIALENLSEGVKAGLTLYQINDGHFDLFIRKNDSNLDVVFGYQIKSLGGEKPITIEASDLDKIKIRITSNASKYFFEYSVDDGKTYDRIDEQDVFLISTEVVGGFTGVIIGMFAEGEGKVEFGYFDYTEIEEEKKE